MEQLDDKEFSSLKRSRSAHASQLARIYIQLEREMVSKENIENVSKLFEKLKQKFEIYKRTHLLCLDKCQDPDACDELEQGYLNCHKNYVEFSERFAQWSQASENVIEDCDNCSVLSGSSTSSRARIVSAKAKRLIAEQKLKTMKQKIDLERAKREIKYKQQLLESQSEVDQAKLEESVWSEEMQNDGDVDVNQNVNAVTEQILNNRLLQAPTTSNDVTPSHPVKLISSNTQRPNNQEVTTTGMERVFERLAVTWQEGFNLPKPELLRFSGSVFEYSKFMNNFETNIESKYCDGEAKSAIEDCVLMQPSEGYKEARNILYSRYGRPHNIARSHVDKLVNGQQLKASDTDGLSNLALEMRKCEITLSQLGFKSDIDNTENLRRLVRRLPMHIRSRWVDVAYSITETGREPIFSDLVKFVDEKARIATSAYGIDLAKERSHGNEKSDTKSKPVQNILRNNTTNFNINGENKTSVYTRTCACCSGKCVDLASCLEFKNMPLSEREKFVRNQKLCFNCLKGKHFANICRKNAACTVPECTAKHHFLLHSWFSNDSDHTVTSPSVNCAATKGSFMKNCLGIVPVTVLGESGKSCKTYALLDDGADKTLCDERLLKVLGLSGTRVKFQMTTASSTGSTFEGTEVDLRVRSVCQGTEVVLRKAWSVKTLPISAESAVKKSDLRNLPYLTDIEIPEIDARSVMLLIGTDTPQAHIPLEVRSGSATQPYAVRTELGWTVRGPVPVSSDQTTANVNFQQSADSLLQNQVNKLWDTDFDEKIRLEKTSMSVEDKRATEIMENSVKHENGHYSLRLPWRNKNAILPNDIAMARARLQCLKKKLSKDPELHRMYTSTVSDYIENGYAEKVETELTDNTRVWYSPHHPVTNPNKPGKVRVVFDCAAKYKDISLNDQLLQGPDLMNSLVGVIIRFRQEPVAIAADIEAMFHQVRVENEDRDALRFLWWPNGDLSKEPQHYRMKVHLFGATSSPSCTAFALKRAASDHKHMYGPETISTVNRNFYVDDCLKSVCTEENAILLASELQSIMKKGGFRLTKWLSNSRNVMDSIPKSERAPSIVDLGKDDELPVDRALGVYWDVERDEIQFRAKISEKPLTRRGILSVVSSIFDPLGLVSPVTLRAKAIVQNLCRIKLGWDYRIPEQYANEWQRWLSALSALEELKVKRCFKPSSFGKIQSAQIHVFCDGSELGYGACAYLRLVDEHDNVNCSLVVGKSRLAPMKQMSIPRLELSGAVVAARLYGMVADELEIKIDKVTFWTDSTIVLGYIKNESRRFKTFVGNRIGQIHQLTNVEQWRHVDTNSNPADIASRGVESNDFSTLKFWLNGPEFLLRDERHWPNQAAPQVITEHDVEVKRKVSVNVVTSDMNNVLNYYSDWTKLTTSIAWLMRYKDYCRRKYLEKDIQPELGQLTVSEMTKATKHIIRQVQAQCFPEEADTLAHGKLVKKSSRILSLDPLLEEGIIKAAGRVDRTSCLPIILPNDHHVTNLIIRHSHENLSHVGTQQVLSVIREKYWIIKGHATVKKVLKSCVTCRRLHGSLANQKMAPLLNEQTTPEMPPFTFVGIDYFGPLTIKQGRSRVNRYGCIFTCLTTRAVHFEVAHSLTTSSFISAFQRFESRRGRPKKVFSDNGTNLNGGDRELRESITDWNHAKINRHFIQREIEWHFNPPTASHMGGAWERLIRSTREIMRALVKEQLLNDEQLLTFMAEAEKILNDRPLTPVSADPNDPPALTPSMLLLMKSNKCLPAGIFEQKDCYSKRWWKQVQYLADVFWKRWLKEYLPLLQKRQKWQRKVANIKLNDIVLVSTENAPRGQWPLARVIEVNRSRDGLVRSCVVRTQTGLFVRPITKLCLLEGAE